jgi:hypothetical protein
VCCSQGRLLQMKRKQLSSLLTCECSYRPSHRSILFDVPFPKSVLLSTTSSPTVTPIKTLKTEAAPPFFRAKLCTLTSHPIHLPQLVNLAPIPMVGSGMWGKLKAAWDALGPDRAWPYCKRRQKCKCYVASSVHGKLQWPLWQPKSKCREDFVTATLHATGLRMCVAIQICTRGHTLTLVSSEWRNGNSTMRRLVLLLSRNESKHTVARETA